MKKNLVPLAGIAALLLFAFVIAAVWYERGETKLRVDRDKQVAKQFQADASLFVRPHSRSFGRADAKVTVVEFLDPECEACRAMYPLVKELLATYDGRIRVVIRYMPLHPNSSYAVRALEAAGEQGRFEQMLEILFLNQPEWASHHAPKPELIPGYAEKIGLDMDAFRKSVGSGTHQAVLDADLADGRALGVSRTPTFFVNGRLLPSLGYEAIQQLVEEELAK